MAMLLRPPVPRQFENGPHVSPHLYFYLAHTYNVVSVFVACLSSRHFVGTRCMHALCHVQDFVFGSARVYYSFYSEVSCYLSVLYKSVIKMGPKKKSKDLESLEISEECRKAYLKLLDTYFEKNAFDFVPPFNSDGLLKLKNSLQEPETALNSEKRAQLRSFYDICGDHVIKKRKSLLEPIRRYVACEDAYDLILNAHLSTDHAGLEEIIQTLRPRYCVSKMAIKLFLSLCQVCTSKGCAGMIKKNGYLNDSCKIAIMMVKKLDESFRYILVVVDNATDFAHLRALTSGDHVTVAMELLKIFTDFGPPKVIDTNAEQFFNIVVDSIRKMVPEFVISVRVNQSGVPVGLRGLTYRVEKYLIEWQNKSDSISWAFGVHMVQWRLNNTKSFTLETSFQNLFYRSPNSLVPEDDNGWFDFSRVEKESLDTNDAPTDSQELEPIVIEDEKSNSESKEGSGLKQDDIVKNLENDLYECFKDQLWAEVTLIQNALNTKETNIVEQSDDIVEMPYVKAETSESIVKDEEESEHLRKEEQELDRIVMELKRESVAMDEQICAGPSTSSSNEISRMDMENDDSDSDSATESVDSVSDYKNDDNDGVNAVVFCDDVTDIPSLITERGNITVLSVELHDDDSDSEMKNNIKKRCCICLKNLEKEFFTCNNCLKNVHESCYNKNHMCCNLCFKAFVRKIRKMRKKSNVN